jgi:hypothetical protein
MSDLEKETAPLVQPMLSGLALRLYETDQRTLAYWALKTAMVAQEANRKLGVAIPPQQAEAIYNARAIRPRQPIDAVTVWLARHRGPSLGFAYLSVHSTASPQTLAARHPDEEHRYWAAFRIGAVTFHILGHTLPPGNVTASADPLRLLQIWPARSVIQWPPHASFDDHEFDQIVRQALPSAHLRSQHLWLPSRRPSWAAPGDDHGQ